MEINDKYYIYVKSIISDLIERVKCSYNDYILIDTNTIYYLSFNYNSCTGNQLLFSDDSIYK